MKNIRFRLTSGAIAVLGTVLIPVLTDLPSAFAQHHETMPQSTTMGQGQTIVMHLNHSTDDLHAAFMALKLGTNLRKQGAEVMLVLTLEGVRIADKNQPIDLRWGSNPITLAELYEQFVAAGGKVMVCPMCAEAAGISADDLRTGAELAEGNQDIANLILAADKVVDF
ncbi:MAG: DsrE family protein [Pegethrix bostrychoides GSE-TBD4-15B]|uniref:DsrE family protein n=1 Tax=Pegethrix bostrychoides GSE-TBD4-15B TaxID=2839662 RepID=A0A951U5P6_9CYAN|nr:DsrE family protein [Pegethrix bostrychoides GSE-TBD4-15B]